MSEDAEPTLVGEQSESQKFSKNKSKKDEEYMWLGSSVGRAKD